MSDPSTRASLLEKKVKPWPDNVVLHNILYQLGIRPKIDILRFKNPNLNYAYLKRCKSLHHKLRPKKVSLEEYSNNNTEKMPQNQVWGVFWWKN